MTQLWKKSAYDYQSSAKVVDGNLIISLPDAINPIVWRMELGSVKASALEVRTQDATGHFMLTLKTPKGDVHDIAPFTTREDAVRALMRVSAALQGAEGKIAPTAPFAANTSAPHTAPARNDNATPAWKWLIALVGVVIVVFLFAYVSSLAPQTGSSGTGSAATSTGGHATEQSGMPESADKLLGGF